MPAAGRGAEARVAPHRPRPGPLAGPLSVASFSSRSGGCFVPAGAHQIPTFPLVQPSFVTVMYLVPGGAFTSFFGSQSELACQRRTCT